MSVLDLIQHNSSQLEMFSEPMRVIGIDLGTTNSTVTEVTRVLQAISAVSLLNSKQPGVVGGVHWYPP